MTSSLRFHERMSGWVSFDEHSYNQAARDGHVQGNACAHELEIEIDDLDRFFADPRHEAVATGSFTCDCLGGTYAVGPGSTFNLFAPAANGDAGRRHRRMLYRLLLSDDDGRQLTLSGFKDLCDDPGLDVRADTTRLFVRLIAGHTLTDPVGNHGTVATGILYIDTLKLLKMAGSFRGSGGLRGWRSVEHFARFFLDGLEAVYVGPARTVSDEDFLAPGPLDGRWHGHPPGQWHELRRHPGIHRRIIGFEATDPQRTTLTLHHLRGEREPTRGPVMLVPGAGVRANLFYGAPREPTLARTLIEDGYDVWIPNWRASIDLPPMEWTLDQAAVYDHPAAVATIRRLTGARTLGAVIHCQGSTSFTMAAVAGLVPEVTTIVSNAVSLHVDATLRSKLKTRLLLPPIALWLPGIDAQWAVRSPTAIAHLVARTAQFIRRADCDNEVCQVANFMYGSGPDMLWRHENLDLATHDWISREFGFCPFSFLRQIGRSQRRGHLVPVDGLAELPADLTAGEPRTDARWTFLAGSENRVFLPSGQRRSFEFFERFRPGHNRHYELAGLSHLDVMFGRTGSREVFPLILDALGRDDFD